VGNLKEYSTGKCAGVEKTKNIRLKVIKSFVGFL